MIPRKTSSKPAQATAGGVPNLAEPFQHMFETGPTLLAERAPNRVEADPVLVDTGPNLSDPPATSCVRQGAHETPPPERAGAKR